MTFKERDPITAEDWRKVQSQELYKLYASSSIISVIKSRRIGWVGHVVHMGDIRNKYKNFCQEN
jgi:hypothetical protein